MDGGISGVKNLENEEYSAIFTFNDLMAYGVYKQLKAEGKQIPHDISVIGYDDIQFSQMLEVPLTSVHQPVGKLGSVTTRYLIEKVEGGNLPENIPTYTPKLVIRNSTSTPKDGIE